MKTSYYLLVIFYALSCLISQKASAQIFHEDFEIIDSVTVSGQGIYQFVSTSQVQTSGTYSGQATVGDSSVLYITSIPINTVGLTGALLSFKHICRIDFFDAGTVEVSNDGGLTFQQLTCAEQLPGNADSAAFCGQTNAFSSATTLDWDPGVPATVATNAMWHSAHFNLSMFLPANSLLVRFKLHDRNNSGAGGYPGWYIDDVVVNQYFQLVNINNTNLDSCSVPHTQPITVNGYALGFNANDSVTAQVYFGDGTDTILSIPIAAGWFNAIINHTYTAPGNYVINITATSPNSITQSYVFSIDVGVKPNCGSIGGTIYIDLNSNCVFDSGETLYRYVKVDLYDNNVYIQSQYSNYAGKFVFYNMPNTGNYMIKADTLLYNFYQVACPSSGFYNVASIPSLNNDFGYACSVGFNLGAYIHGNGFTVIPGAIRGGFIETRNYSCNPAANAVAKLVLPPQVTYVSSTVTPQSISGDTITWSTPFAANGSFGTFVWYIGDTTLTINDTVCFTVIAEPLAGDINTLNNIETSCRAVGVSYDPNNKTVMPEGNILPGQMLNYTVNFQNTGTAPAQNVYVLDTLDANLDLSSLNITSTSHSARFYVLPGRVLKAEFPNIMLPDSNANEPLSHGFYSYTIHAKNSLVNGDYINNTANIYFDYNPAIVTNTTYNTIQVTVGKTELTNASEMVIYPNPFTNEFTITGTKKMDVVYLRSIKGELLLTQNINDTSAKINVQQLPSGVYVLTATCADETKFYKVVKL